MKPVLIVLPAQIALLTLLGGCASLLSGIGGSENLSCKAPEGVVCTSVSGVYANAANIAARSMPVPPFNAKPVPTDTYQSNATATQNRTPPAVPGATRSNPRVLRLWIAPWEDSDGDLHEASTVNVLVDSGRWLIDPIRPSVRNRVDAVSPPATSSTERNAPNAEAEKPITNDAQPFASTPAFPFNSFPR